MKIRLEEWEIKEIIKSFKECFGGQDHLWLFGSRVDMNKRGGDIDLYIELEKYEATSAEELRDTFFKLLQDRLGEQKIDIVIRNPSQVLSIHRIARQEGIRVV